MLNSKGNESDDDTAVFHADPRLVAAVLPPRAIVIEYEEIPKLLFVDMQQQHEEKVAAAVTKLTTLLARSNEHRQVNVDESLSLGAIAIILLLMQKWHSNRSIQFDGCCVLARLAYIDSVGDDATIAAVAAEAAVAIIKSGGIETIMAAMESFPCDADIQRKGCNAIGNAFYYTKPTIDNAMARFVHKLNGIELVLTVMKIFSKHSAVQRMGCHVLQQLSRKQELRDALKKGSAPSAVCEAAEKHDDNILQSAANVFFQNIFA